MTNQQKVLRLYPTAICKKMVSVITGINYYILVPNDLDAIPMRFYKEQDDAWEYAYRINCKESLYGQEPEVIQQEVAVIENYPKVHPWNAKRLKHNPPFIKIQ